jgi:hypothetical protein
MRLAGLAALALLALPVPAAAAAQGAEIVVRGDVARTEIERILDEDNVDTSRLSAGEVAQAIRGIRRGRAPDDFWRAYQAHVAAWIRLAQASESLEETLAEQAIDSSFDEVERISRLYHARLPTPPWKVLPTV